jgi:hypothetical protein
MGKPDWLDPDGLIVGGRAKRREVGEDLLQSLLDPVFRGDVR